MCSYNKFTELDLSGCPQLNFLECSGLNKLDVRDNTLLEFLHCRVMKCATLDLSNNPLLVQLEVTGSVMETLNLSENVKLVELDCWGMPNLTMLDVSNHSKLWRLSCNMNPKMDSLFLKTGQTIERLDKDEHTMIVFK
jgi:hypothetical protein